MKAAVYYSQDDVRYEDTQKPKIGSGDLLMKMEVCGVCGSDLMDWYLKDRAPLVLGHEPAGVVVEVGEKVEGFQVGDRIFAHHHVACLTCYYCNHGDYTLCRQFTETHLEPGGFAEYVKVPKLNVKVDTLKIPANLSFEEATLIEPLACCIRGIEKCNVKVGDAVLVVGAGPAGLIHVQLATLLGASEIIVSDLVEYRRNAALNFGADVVFDPNEEEFMEVVKRETDGRGADVVIVTAPSRKAVYEGLEACRRGGLLCLFAPTPPDVRVEVSPNRIFFDEVKIVSSYSTSHVETRKALRLIGGGRIKTKELISHRFPLSRTGEAINLAAKSRECLKVVVRRED